MAYAAVRFFLFEKDVLSGQPLFAFLTADEKK